MNAPQHLVAVVIVAFAAGLGLAQDVREPQDDSYLSSPKIVNWEFGIEITGTGDAIGLTTIVPIPIDWPEQKIISTKLIKTEGVSKIAYKELEDLAKIMSIGVSAIRNGDVERAVVQMEIEKSNLVAPVDTAQFVFAKKTSGKLSKFVKPSPYIESRHIRIRRVSESIEIDAEDTAWDQVESIYTWVRDNIEYKFDQQIHSCVEALDAGHGDCEELTSLFIAICRQRGIPARAVWIPHHTYPEFYLEDANGTGRWFPCQAAGTYEFGSMTDHSPILHKGDNFRVPGHKKPMRYVQPTLKAQRLTSEPQLKWIMHDTDKKDDPNQYLKDNSIGK